MKEIKFKAKDINDNWVSGQYVYDERNKIHHIVDGNVYYKIKRKTICQYITTRNRIELYEGDTVSRSEEHTSELQSPLNISYAVFCLDRKSVV